jgi:D-ribose pyranose/furanose isomerase RbsD
MSRNGKRFVLPAVCSLLLLAACGRGEREDNGEEEGAPVAMTWGQKLAQDLPALGHRNWIVVADSAFPLQVSPGIEVIVSGEDHFAVLEKVLKAVDTSKHVRPRIYLDKELNFVTEELAPGIDACRERLKETLKGRGPASVLHASLLNRLSGLGRTLRILIIKTNLALPYTSVFMELDCGYWPSQSEAKMREQMKNAASAAAQAPAAKKSPPPAKKKKPGNK